MVSFYAMHTSEKNDYVKQDTLPQDNKSIQVACDEGLRCTVLS